MAMLMMMAFEDQNHRHGNIDFFSATDRPKGTAIGTEAIWLRDLMPLIDPVIYGQMRKLLNGSVAVSGGIVDRQLFEDTAKNITMILQGLSESYHAEYAKSADEGLMLWDPGCFPHPNGWRMREAVGALLA